MAYYYKSEKMAAYWALKDLEKKLPQTPQSASDWPEWGTIIFRWPDKEEGGYKYAYQPIYPAIHADGMWHPANAIPSYAEEWAFCHNHPNNKYFSTIDTNTARTMPTVMYMVNRKGGYWYDGRLEGASDTARKGKLWGTY